MILWVLLFLAAAFAIWRAGIVLVQATDVIDARWNLGQALGGTVLLAIVTNLPEIAIMVSAALKGNLGVIVGNLLGGVAIQTVLLALFDWRMKSGAPLTRRASSPALLLEGVLVVAVLNVCIMGTQLPASLIFERLTPAPLLTAALWLFGLWLINRADRQAGPQAGVDELAAGLVDGPAQNPPDAAKAKKAYVQFAAAALVTLAAGVALEWAGEAIAQELNMSGVLFGATFLALATALPEISTGLQAIKEKEYQLAVSDIFGGNAFLPVLLVPSTLIAGEAVLPLAAKTDIYIAALASLLTCIYIGGLLLRPQRRFARMGVDSAAVAALYLAGIAGLFFI